METIALPITKYEEMTNKIARFNALISCIRQEIDAGNKYPVDSELVLSITGLKTYKHKKEGEAQC